MADSLTSSNMISSKFVVPKVLLLKNKDVDRDKDDRKIGSFRRRSQCYPH